MRSQGDALGWYALPRWGKWNVPLVQFERAGFVATVSDRCLEGCGLGAKCESRDQRAQLQGRLGRRVVVVSDLCLEGCGLGAKCGNRGGVRRSLAVTVLEVVFLFRERVAG
jgi:hypothetical protein